MAQATDKKPSAATLKKHYAAQLAALDKYGIGMVNHDQNPLPRPERFDYEKLPESITSTARPFKTPLPNMIQDCNVLLIGCGTGEDAYVLAKQVGPNGHVLAIDPDSAAISVAKKNKAAAAKALGVDKLPVDFTVGYPERLDLAKVEEESLDSIIFNLTFNMALDKRMVLQEIWRCLKPKGEIYGSVLISTRRFLEPLLKLKSFTHPVVRGAIYLNDFRKWMREAGWPAFRYMQKREAVLTDSHEKKLLSEVGLNVSIIRMFKFEDTDETCENYGQSAEYLGNAPGCTQFFDLDDCHRFFVDKPLRVCGNTAALVQDTRFAQYFLVCGGKMNKHFGIYDYCPYTDHSIDDKLIIEYHEDGKPVCADCSHSAHCIHDGHCQHEEGTDVLAEIG